jgi:hypothetical protein
METETSGEGIAGFVSPAFGWLASIAMWAKFRKNVEKNLA